MASSLRISRAGRLGRSPPDPTAVGELFVAINNLNQMAGTVPVATPWTAPNAGTWDGQTLETWKQANLHVPNARALFDSGIGAVFAAEPSDLSLLFTLFYIASGTNETTPPRPEPAVQRPGRSAGQPLHRRLPADLEAAGEADRE